MATASVDSSLPNDSENGTDIVQYDERKKTNINFNFDIHLPNKQQNVH